MSKKIETLKRINAALEQARKNKQAQQLAAAELKEEERKEEEATKLAMSMAMNEALISELQEIRSEISKGSNISVNAPDVNVTVPEVKVPEIKIPTIKVPEFKMPAFPEIKLPTINVPEPKVTVNIPKIDIPEIKAPEVNIDIPDAVFLKGIDKTSPLPVLMMGADGKPFQSWSSGGGGISKAILQESKANVGNVSIKAQDSPSIDAFGRWRVSQPETIFDSKQVFDSLPLLYDDQEVSGSGTGSTHNPNHAATEMTVSASTAGKRVRQSFMRMNYQPGKSQLILCTGTLGAGGTGITAAMGYFDDNNGLFAMSDNGVAYFVKRTSYTGSPVDTKVAQSSWNIDPFDGTGPSGVKLDPTKSQILFIDFEWLGVGRVRMGWVVDGNIYYAHEFLHANNQAGVYMSTPNLPIRYEIENDGTGGAATLEHICSSVISEGGIQNNGYLRHYDSGAVTGLSNASAYAVMGGRLKSTHLGATVLVENISIVGSANDQAHWELRIGGTVAGTFTYSDITNSAVQVATGTSANTVTGGIEIDGGYFTTTQAVSFTVPNALHLGATIDNTPQEWQLVIIPITNNMTVRASVTWRELL